MSSSPLPAIVHAIRKEADNVMSIVLRPQDVSSFPAYSAGAHIDLHLPNGLIRSYSLLRPMDASGAYTIGVLNDRNSRGGSRYVHEALQEGMSIAISAPRNNFALNETASHTVLVAGGIGITPMLCMLHSLAALQRPATLIYCARSRNEAAFIGELETLAAAAGHIAIHWHFDDEQAGPPDLAHLLQGQPPDTHLYCCGPEPMLNAFERICETLHYAHAHIERFSAITPGAASNDVPVIAEGICHVELQRSKKSFDIPFGTALLDRILAAGVAQDNSCREGVCGACETRVIEGTIVHRDSILTKKEQAANKVMMVCVSGCNSARLVLDI